MNEHPRSDPFETAEPFAAAEPVPLAREVPAAEPYPTDALGPLRPVAEAIADITQAPPAIAAQSVLAVASLATQGIADAETLGGPRPASLYCLTIARSGERKSSCDRLAMEAVRDFEAELRETRKEELTDWKIAVDIWETRRKEILAKAKGDKGDPSAAKEELKRLGDEPEKPLFAALVSTEPTVEGLVKNMPQLRASLGLFADEGGAFFGGHAMKAENKLRTLAAFSSFWDGRGADRWRAEDGVSVYPGRRLAAHLMAQPVAVADLLSDPVAREQGFLARFLVAAPESTIGTRTRRGHAAGSDAAVRAFGWKIGQLLRRPLPLKEGTRNELDPPTLDLEDDAREVLDDFAVEVEKGQAPGGPFESVTPWASKTAEQAARIAAVLTLYADPDAEAVEAETMADAIRLATHSLGEARRLTDGATVSKETADAERLRRWLVDRWPEPYISAADAAQRGPFKETDRNRHLMVALAAHGWLGPEEPAEVAGKRRRAARRVNRGGDG